MKTSYLPFACFFLIGIMAANCAAQDAPPTPTRPTKEEQEIKLIEAQLANQAAQTAYYQAQKRKLEETPSPKTFWTSIQENPASILGVSAAFVAFISFVFNYRSTLISQENTEFYEALQRFGDKDSVALRASSAGILAQMAGIRRHRWWLKALVFKASVGDPVFFTTVRNQLTFGYLSEESEVGLLSISDALRQLLKLNSVETTERLYRISERLMSELIESLADYLVTRGVTARNEITKEHLEKAPTLGFPPRILNKLVGRFGELFDKTLTHKALIYASFPDDKRVEAQSAAHSRLRHVFFRLDRLVRLFNDAFKYPLAEVNKLSRAHQFHCLAKFQGNNFHAFNFKTALLAGANLDRADLTEASLEGALLYNASLKDAKMWKARVDDKTDLNSCAWWKASYFEENSSVVDENLVRTIAEKFPIPADEKEIHPSVLKIFPAPKPDARTGEADKAKPA